MRSTALRRYRSVSVAASVLAILLSATAAQAQNQHGASFAGVELLGRGILYTVNFERYARRAGAGIGIAAWRFDKTILIVPIYVSLRPIGHTHSLYLSAGATVGLNVSALATSPTAVYGTATVGYEHLSKSGLVLRPTYTFLFAPEGGVLWPGFQIGYRF